MTKTSVFYVGKPDGHDLMVKMAARAKKKHEEFTLAWKGLLKGDVNHHLMSDSLGVN